MPKKEPPIGKLGPINGDACHYPASCDISLREEDITSSKPYAALVERMIKALSRESSFHWDKTRPRTMVDCIREVIQTTLSDLSLAKQPVYFDARFRLPWAGIRYRMRQQPRRQLLDLLVLTGCSDDQFQLTTINEYLGQTWASGWETLLATIQKLADSSHGARNEAIEMGE
jgi:hypothetical protein